ncbi:MAG: iron-containing alcohol dehydrogenase [Smithella sp.]
MYDQKTNPQIVLVDTTVIANAPVRFLISGMGDAPATWFEARSCDRTRSLNACAGHGTPAGLHPARLYYDTLMAYGAAAKIAAEKHLVTPASKDLNGALYLNVSGGWSLLPDTPAPG